MRNLALLLSLIIILGTFSNVNAQSYNESESLTLEKAKKMLEEEKSKPDFNVPGKVTIITYTDTEYLVEYHIDYQDYYEYTGTDNQKFLSDCSNGQEIELYLETLDDGSTFIAIIYDGKTLEQDYIDEAFGFVEIRSQCGTYTGDSTQDDSTQDDSTQDDSTQDVSTQLKTTPLKL